MSDDAALPVHLLATFDQHDASLRQHEALIQQLEESLAGLPDKVAAAARALSGPHQLTCPSCGHVSRFTITTGG